MGSLMPRLGPYSAKIAYKLLFFALRQKQQIQVFSLHILKGPINKGPLILVENNFFVKRALYGPYIHLNPSLATIELMVARSV